jgi:hypothetical protein
MTQQQELVLRQSERESRADMERALRFGADRIALFHLCGDRGCVRAKACRGDVRACARLAEIWLAAIEAEIKARPDFAAIERGIETAEELRAYRAWRRALSASSRAARAGGRR